MATEYTNGRDGGLSSDSIVDTPCQPCSASDKSCQANYFCVDCQDCLCFECTAHHRVLKITCGHNLMTLEEKEKNPKAAVRDKCTEKCSVHTNKTVKYLCVPHSHLGCTVCAITYHKQCPDVRHIPSVAQRIENHKEFKQFKDKLKALETVAKDSITTMSTAVGKMDMAAKLKLSVEKVRCDLNNALDKIEREMTSKVEKIQVEQKAKLNEFSSACQTVSSKKLEKASVESFKLAEFTPSKCFSEHDAFGKLVIKNEPIDIAPVLVKLTKLNLLKKKLDGPTMAKLVRVGGRVRRGKDWKYEDQEDNNGEGTVLSLPYNMNTGLIYVEWDHGHKNEYRMGRENAYDLELIL